MLKDGDFSFNVSVDNMELIKEGEVKWLKFGGTCLEPVTSRNKVKYTVDNIKELDNSSSKFFVTHKLDPNNSVGHVKYTQVGNSLKYDARARNTVHHPDIVEAIQERRVDMSIDARYGKIWVAEAEGDTKHFRVSGLQPRGLCAVGVGGIPGNTIDYAIAEEFKKNDIKIEEEKTIKEHDEVEQMSESEDNKKILQENEELKNELKQLRESNKLREEENKKEIVKELENLNKDLKGSELVEKSVKELEIMLDYEKKLAVKEQEEEGEEKPEESEEGGAEVPSEEEEATQEEDFNKGVVIEKEGDVGFGVKKSFNQKMYDKFNKDIRKSVSKQI